MQFSLCQWAGLAWRVEKQAEQGGHCVASPAIPASWPGNHRVIWTWNQQSKGGPLFCLPSDIRNAWLLYSIRFSRSGSVFCLRHVCSLTRTYIFLAVFPLLWFIFGKYSFVICWGIECAKSYQKLMSKGIFFWTHLKKIDSGTSLVV